MIQKYEYQVINRGGGWTNLWEGEKIELQEYLNKKGKEGWELVQGPTYQYPDCIFKRPINTP